jgi:hypothetical protein
METKNYYAGEASITFLLFSERKGPVAKHRYDWMLMLKYEYILHSSVV